MDCDVHKRKTNFFHITEQLRSQEFDTECPADALLHIAYRLQGVWQWSYYEKTCAYDSVVIHSVICQSGKYFVVTYRSIFQHIQPQVDKYRQMNKYV